MNFKINEEVDFNDIEAVYSYFEKLSYIVSMRYSPFILITIFESNFNRELTLEEKERIFNQYNNYIDILNNVLMQISIFMFNVFDRKTKEKLKIYFKESKSYFESYFFELMEYSPEIEDNKFIEFKKNHIKIFKLVNLPEYTGKGFFYN
jgi:hypothetical protein